MLDERAQELVMYKQVRFGEFKEKTRIPVGRGLCGTAAATKQPVLVGDVTKDPRYVDLLVSEDPFENNPGRKTGLLVTAAVGKGTWTYVGLGLFRQLPAGVPGAYRLLANLVCSPGAVRPAAPSPGSFR